MAGKKRLRRKLRRELRRMLWWKLRRKLRRKVDVLPDESTHDIEEDGADNGRRQEAEEGAAPYLGLEVAHELLTVVRLKLLAGALEGFVI